MATGQERHPDVAAAPAKAAKKTPAVVDADRDSVSSSVPRQRKEGLGRRQVRSPRHHHRHGRYRHAQFQTFQGSGRQLLYPQSWAKICHNIVLTLIVKFWAWNSYQQ